MKPLSYAILPYGTGYRIYIGDNKYRKAKTKIKAEAIVRELKLARQSKGRDLADADPAQMHKLIDLNNRCEEAGTSVEAAVAHWLPHYLAKVASVPLADAVDRYLADCQARGLAIATRRDAKGRLGLWVTAQPDADTTVFDAAQVDSLRGFIWDEVERTSAASARNVWAVISAFSTWATHNDLMESNPCVRIAKPNPGERSIVTMSPDDATELLRLAVEHYNREILSYIVISLFGGLRPHEFVSEQGRRGWLHLDWQAISQTGILKDKRLGKIKQARQIPVLPALSAWIDFLREKEGGTLSGPIVSSYSFYQRFRRWKRAHYPVSLPPIENDLLRHSFGTYRVLDVGEVGKVALEMGNSEAMIRQHYLNGEHTAAEATRYWALTPDAVLQKEKFKV